MWNMHAYDHSNESFHWALHSDGIVQYDERVIFVDEKTSVTIKMEQLLIGRSVMYC